MQRVGIEPTRRESSQDFKSCASASSAIPAIYQREKLGESEAPSCDSNRSSFLVLSGRVVSFVSA